MVPKLKKLISNAKAIPLQIDVIITNALEDNKEIAADLITDQLSHGIRGDGEDMAEYRSSEYARLKKSIGSISSPLTDLKLTEAYHNSIKLETTGKEAAIVSRDKKDAELSAKYGEEIKQFTDDSKIEFRQQIKQDMQIRINNRILKQ